MRFQGFFRTLSMAVALTAPFAAHAHQESAAKPVFPEPSQHWNWEQPDETLSQSARKNRELETGEYAFADFHKSGKSFLDTWSFTLADTADITVDLFDFTLPGGGFNSLYPDAEDGDHKYGHGKSNKTFFKSLLDNKYLTVSLFDADDKLLGTAGEDGTLSALGLAGGQWYTLAVSGKSIGMLGGVYHGTLNVDAPAAVPIGDSLPLFASALMVFGLRSKKVRNALRV